MEKVKIIKEIKIDKNKVLRSESVNVEANAALEQYSSADIEISINGLRGSKHILPVNTNNPIFTIFVTATTSDGKYCDFRTEKVSVLENKKQLFPVIKYFIQKNSPYAVDFYVVNHDKLKDLKPIYLFVFDGETKISTKIPRVTYDLHKKYSGNITSKRITHQLYIEVLVNGKKNSSSEFSFNLWDPYVINRHKGRLSLHTTCKTILKDKVSLTTLDILNREKFPVILDTLYTEDIFDNKKSSELSKKKVSKISIKIDGNSNYLYTLKEKVTDFNKGLIGRIYRFRGVGEKYKAEVVGYSYFPFNSSKKVVIDPNVAKKYDLNLFLKETPYPVPINLFNKKLIDLNKSHVLENFTKDLAFDIRNRDFGIDTHPSLPSNLPGNFPVYVGQKCAPGDEPPMPGLVATPTDEFENIYIPACILNARKGDIVLNPGSLGFIGALLKQVEPPCLYSHSGIMVEDYFFLRHSTASESWLLNNPADSDDPSAHPTDGFDSEALQFLWPGTVTQQIDHAFNGEAMPFTFRNGSTKDFWIDGFNWEPNYADSDQDTRVNSYELVFPLVVKPDPVIEGANPIIRQRLNQVAESAKAIKGYYSFFCYTDAAASFKPEFNAPLREGWWASGRRATVCTSLIWTAIKDCGFNIEGAREFLNVADLESQDVRKGAEVDDQTKDGLYFYNETERLKAATWLHDHMKETVYATIGSSPSWGWAAPFVEGFSDMSDDIANQVCNAFGFNITGETPDGHSKDLELWRNPGPGRAVAPDDIWQFWDSPNMQSGVGLYGYSEPLLFMDGHIETRRIYRWQVAKRNGTLKCKVLLNNVPQPGAIIKINDIESFVTNSSGEFTIEKPASLYKIEASKIETATGWRWIIIKECTVIENTLTTIDLHLTPPDDSNREILIYGSVILNDDEWPGGDEHGEFPFLTTPIRLNAAKRSVRLPFGNNEEYRVDEVKTTFDITLELLDNRDVKFTLDLRLFEGSSYESIITELDGQMNKSIIIPKDRFETLTQRLTNTDEGIPDDFVELQLKIENKVYHV